VTANDSTQPLASIAQPHRVSEHPRFYRFEHPDVTDLLKHLSALLQHLRGAPLDVTAGLESELPR
jgi:hypothetical protein